MLLFLFWLLLIFLLLLSCSLSLSSSSLLSYFQREWIATFHYHNHHHCHHYYHHHRRLRLHCHYYRILNNRWERNYNATFRDRQHLFQQKRKFHYRSVNYKTIFFTCACDFLNTFDSNISSSYLANENGLKNKLLNNFTN